MKEKIPWPCRQERMKISIVGRAEGRMRRFLIYVPLLSES